MKIGKKMKRYKLLKDIPFVKAGEIFGLHRGGIKDFITLFKGDEEVYTIKVSENVSEMFNEWFEEIKDPEEYFYISSSGDIEYSKSEWNKEVIEPQKLIGNFFETKEEAEKYLEYLKAKVIIKQDTKGFKPDWKDIAEDKYYGFWDTSAKKLDWIRISILQDDRIYFETKNDIKESFEKHPEEWKTYLTYEK